MKVEGKRREKVVLTCLEVEAALELKGQGLIELLWKRKQ